VSRDLEAGGIVNPGIPIFKIADPQTAWATVYVDGRDTAGLAVGNPADITVRSLPGHVFRGRVARIQREGDRVTEQLAVDLAFAERPPRLILGEQVEATIRPPTHHGAIALPLAAVVRRPDGPGALVVENGRIHFKPARLGVADRAGWIEVLQGFRPGEDVVLAPGRLADASNEGHRVRTTRSDTGP
jgi:HlyD family secretion protein